MKYRFLDMDGYNRKCHFDYFNGLAYPYVGVTVNVDITDFLRMVKEERYPFFLSFCYCVSRAANSVREFRQRILNGRIIEYENCRTSHTVALEDGTYCYCALDASLPFAEFLPYAAEAQDKAREARSLEEKKEDSSELIFISTLPWISYAALVQPVPMPADSNPRITWGKYFKQGERILLPVSVLCHHALVDGLPISRFYGALESHLSTFAVTG